MSTLTIVECPSCKKKNRVDPEREGAKCGACGAALEVAPSVAHVDDDASLRKLLVESPVPVLVDFFATWCGPCQAIAPAIEEIAAARTGKLRVAKLDIDKAVETAARHGVQAVPTLILFKGPKELARLEGALSKAELVRWLDGALAGQRASS